MDHIAIANKKSLEAFVEDYLPPSEKWETWTHPVTGSQLDITLSTAQGLSDADFDACFRLIELTSSEDYRKSKDGWKPRSKRKEMKLLDLKYFLVKHGGQVEGFVSFMPTYEDDYPVIYCYEIHLSAALRGTGFGTALMRHLEAIASKIPGTAKIMLTCFTRNTRSIGFYSKLGYSKDDYSPEPRTLRNGTTVEAEYVILSKAVSR